MVCKEFVNLGGSFGAYAALLEDLPRFESLCGVGRKYAELWEFMRR